jgi:hypothetical protein
MEGFLTKEQILSVNEFEVEAVMEGEARKTAIKNFRMKVVVLGCIDETGNQLFSMKDIGALNKKSSSAIDKISTTILRLSGLRKEDIEEVSKNS